MKNYLWLLKRDNESLVFSSEADSVVGTEVALLFILSLGEVLRENIFCNSNQVILKNGQHFLRNGIPTVEVVDAIL